MKTLYFTLLFLFTNALGFAQLSIEKKVEISLSSDEKNFELINLGRQGLLIFIDSRNQMSNQPQLTVIKYDTLLGQEWKENYAVDFSLVKRLHSINNGRIDFLADVTDSVYQIASFNLANGGMFLINCVNSLDLYAKNFRINHFTSVSDAFVFGGEVGGKPTVLHYDIKSAEFKVLPNINYLKANLINISTSASGKIFSILLENKGNFYYNLYDSKGKLLGNNEIKPDNKKYNFFSFHPYIKNENEQYVIGTYSFFLPQPQGVYVAKFLNNKYINTQFYGFNNFDNFHNHLDSAKKDKILSKIKANRTHRYDYEVTEQNLTISDKQILYVLRANKPNYATKYEVEKDAAPSSEFKIGKYTYNKTEVYTTPIAINPDATAIRSNRRSSQTTVVDALEPSQLRQKNNIGKAMPNRIPQGYIYKNAIICTFNKEGELLWDNAFDFRNIEGYPDANINVASNDTYLTLLQSLNHKIYLSKAYQNKDSKDIYVLDSPLTPIGGIETKQKMMPWYANHFIFVGLVYDSQAELIEQKPKLKLLKVHGIE